MAKLWQLGINFIQGRRIQGPVPVAQTKASMRPSVSRQISGPVVS